MRIRKMIALAIVLLLCVGAVFAQSADARVKKLLDGAKLKYSINDSNNYVVTYTMENNPDRSHIVFVVSSTETYKGTEIREIWSIAAILPDYPDEYTIHDLLETNSTIKAGAWAMEQTEEGEVWVLYTVKVPAASMTSKELANLTYFVAEICDEFEEEYVGDDIY